MVVLPSSSNKGFAEHCGQQSLRLAPELGFKLGPTSVRDVLEHQRRQHKFVLCRVLQATLSLIQIR